MKSEPVVGVQAEIFRWARQTVGLSLQDVATTLKRDRSEIEAWETGNATPTYSQLEKLAYQVYKRPLAVFFLPSPPEEVLPQREFRTLPAEELQMLSRDTYLHIRKAHAYQIALNELFDGKNPSQHQICNALSLSPSTSFGDQVASVREYLGITLERQISWRTDDDALKAWRKTVEDAGIFVFKDSFKQKDISGFCLIDERFPIIYLNNSTTKTRQIFSLLHELVHLLLGINGLSKFDTQYIDRLQGAEKRAEKFCNSFAAELLIPDADFTTQLTQFPSIIEMATEDQFSKLAQRYCVSREAVLRRFLDKGRVSQSFYEAKAKLWASQKKSGGGGGDWYASQNSYLSARFAREVVSRQYRNQISVEFA